MVRIEPAQSVFHNDRLLFYDCFRGLLGKLWIVAPCFATLWDEGPYPPRALVAAPPVPLVGTTDGKGYISDVYLTEISTEDKFFLGWGVAHPKIFYMHWNAVLFQFDVETVPGQYLILHYCTEEGKHEQPFLVPQVLGDYHSALTTLVHNDAHILPEWMEYHRGLGVEHFYIYDNGSSDNLTEVLGDHATLIPWEHPYYYDAPALPNPDQYGSIHGLGCQIPHQIHALYKYGPSCLWLGFIDDDEYINAPPLAELLDTENAVNLIGSVFYGPRVDDEAQHMVRKRYLYRQPFDDLRTFFSRRKPILQPRLFRAGERPIVHDVARYGQAHLNGRYDAFCEDGWCQFDPQIARLNHYYDIGFNRNRIPWGRHEARQEARYSSVLDASLAAD